MLYDVLAHGYTVDDLDDIPDRKLSWRVLLAIVRQQEPSGRSALFRATYPKSWGYTLAVQALMQLDSHMHGIEFEIPSDSPDEQVPTKAKRTSAEIRALVG